MTPLYRRVLGERFDGLPDALRAFHGGPGRWQGTAELMQGGAAARLLVRRLGYPDAEGAIPLTLTVETLEGGETWHRDFGGRAVVSTQRAAPGGRIAERLGPAAVLLAPAVRKGALHLPVAGMALGPLALRAPLSGGGTESAEGGRVRFDVEARLPGLGRLIRYRGHLDRAG